MPQKNQILSLFCPIIWDFLTLAVIAVKFPLPNNLASVYPEITSEIIGKYEKWVSRVGVINWQERKNK